MGTPSQLREPPPVVVPCGLATQAPRTPWARILAPLRGLARSALDVVAPPSCLSCGAAEAEGLSLCGRCLELVPPQRDHPCPRCAGPLGPAADPAACADCARLRPRFAATTAAAPYAGFVGELVRRAKYGRDPLLAVPLAALLVRALRERSAARGADVVVPVPPHPGRSAERGFHLADLLADAAAHALHVPAHTDWLVRVGDPVPQAALPRSERLRAAKGTVALRRPLLPWVTGPAPAGRSVLVVDDVLTTGATADACARALLDAGAAAVQVAVVARA